MCVCVCVGRVCVWGGCVCVCVCVWGGWVCVCVSPLEQRLQQLLVTAVELQQVGGQAEVPTQHLPLPGP